MSIPAILILCVMLLEIFGRIRLLILNQARTTFLSPRAEAAAAIAVNLIFIGLLAWGGFFNV